MIKNPNIPLDWSLEITAEKERIVHSFSKSLKTAFLEPLTQSARMTHNWTLLLFGQD